MKELNEEISGQYIRGNHQIEFNYTLPYSEERQKLFRGILDEDYFIPLKNKTTAETDRKALLQLPYETPGEFQRTVLLMRKLLHQAMPQKINSLIVLNKDIVRYENSLLVSIKFAPKLTLPDFMRIQKDCLNDYIRDFKARMFDSYYELSDMVDKEIFLMKERNELRTRTMLEHERKQLEEKELPPDVYQSLKSYEMLLNMLFERAIKHTLEISLRKQLGQFSFLIDYFNKHQKNASLMLTKENITAGTFGYESIYQFQEGAQFEKHFEKYPQLYT